jgi:hypothetical protein
VAKPYSPLATRSFQFFEGVVVLFIRWRSCEYGNPELLHNPMQHFRLERNHNRIKIYVIGEGLSLTNIGLGVTFHPILLLEF